MQLYWLSQVSRVYGMRNAILSFLGACMLTRKSVLSVVNLCLAMMF